MNLKYKNILLISPEPWGTNFVSKHHYAKELAQRDSKVYFLNRPSDGFSAEVIEKNLSIVNYNPKFRGLGKLPSYLSAYLIKHEIKTLEKKIGVVFDVIWNFDSSRFFNMSLLNNKLRICHIVDMSENIQRPLLAASVDICFCTSDFISNELSPYNRNVYKVHHGYKVPKKNHQVNEQFDRKKIQVGYVGNLTRSCIDWGPICNLIQSHPEVQFNFIGGVNISNLSRKDIEEERLLFLKNQSNVTLLGQKKSALIPSYLEHFDVLLCAYKVGTEEDIKQHSNLHKLMEYIGSGKVTVSTYVDEYKDKNNLLEMVDSTDDFLVRFREVIKDISFYNSSEKQLERKVFVLSNTYVEQLNRIEIFIDKI